MMRDSCGALCFLYMTVCWFSLPYNHVVSVDLQTSDTGTVNIRFRFKIFLPENTSIKDLN